MNRMGSTESPGLRLHLSVVFNESFGSPVHLEGVEVLGRDRDACFGSSGISAVK